jgi:hypothetical protein
MDIEVSVEHIESISNPEYGSIIFLRNISVGLTVTMCNISEDHSLDSE